ncbi:MAG: cell surface protein SprA [Prevotella sp.]|nr:cell surface protein SprA [Prevotella sp.]
MRRRIYLITLAMLVLSIAAFAVSAPTLLPGSQPPPGNRPPERPSAAQTPDNQGDTLPENPHRRVLEQPILAEDDEIPDSLLHPLWKVQRTMPIDASDLSRNAADLRLPQNVEPVIDYNDTTGYYTFGSRMAGTYVQAPLAMTYEEYVKWSEKQLLSRLFREKNAASYENNGKEPFDFTDMHFDLGPAEKIFGPGGVRITTQGTAELKFGATMKNVQNPSLPIKRRKTTSIDFDEKINFNMTGKVGDKVNMGLNYNTDATFDYDAQNMKLKYEGKEDEIIKLVEGGNITFPSNSSLIPGSSALFGIRTDLQFGKLQLQAVVSQKKSSSTSVSSKGGVQLTSFDIDVADYDENRHFFLSHYFREKYDTYMKTIPNVTTGITINRIEIWVTNTSGTTSNTRNIVALTDLGEPSVISNSSLWHGGGALVPSNAANTEYSSMTTTFSAARDIDQTSTVLDAIAGFEGGADYEKLEKARLLTSNEYTLNTSMGYVTLSSALRTDQVLAVAYEYTYGGVTYQVGEFSGDITDVTQALFVKALRNTASTPEQGNWKLMMRNVYNLGGTLQKEKFRLDVKYQNDTTGVYVTYIPETQVKNQMIIKLLGADRLDNNNKTNPNGYFDYVDGYTVHGQYVYFPVAEPFGDALINALVKNGVSRETAESYAFTELYEQTKTSAKQIAEKDKYKLTGQYKGSRDNVISLGTTGAIPQGSVVVTAGGVTLTEGTDYTVDYSAGEVTIINQSIIDAGTTINASVESQSDYAQMRKTMIGLNWEYDFSKDFQMSGTFQHLSEQALTTKVTMGSEPLNNTLWGLNINWKKESQWLTNILNYIPFLHVTQPSQISFQGEFAQLIAGQSHGTQDNASYIDDFENTKTTIDVSTPSSWVLSSVPSMFQESTDKTTLKSGYNRSLLAWYNIDPLFTRRSSSLTPSHIKSDLDQLSNHYVREVYVSELYPNRDQSSYSGATSTLSILNLAYYPNERGPYNFDPNIQYDGTVYNPASHWGGMMRMLDTSDFETANVEYIEFWMLDPFIYTREEGTASQYGGDLYFNLGEVSEDILRDGKKFYESGMPVDGTSSYTTTQWGKIPNQSTVTYAFATSSGSRQLQDVGLNGLTDEEERSFASYQDFLTQIQGKVSAAVWDSIYNDPAGDDYHYFRGSDYDSMEASILRRYKYINNPQGNSPDSDTRSESYDTSYKTTPDAEDINQDYTLNEYENYYQYAVSIRPEDMVVGTNHIVDKRESSVKLRNGNTETATWYQFRIPVDDWDSKTGSISDFTSIRFMRMFMTGFEKPIVLRFGSLDLVRGEWRVYDQTLDGVSGTGTLDVSAVNIEENNDKTPVNYTLPPGIRRDTDPTQPQLVESNEQALALTLTNLSSGESKCVYQNTTLDLRLYKHLQMFVHANALDPNTTGLEDSQLTLFLRLGSDYKNNYYEYEVPLTLTPAGHYDQYSTAGCQAVWPEENMIDIQTSIFTSLKKDRNKAKAQGLASYSTEFSVYDDDNPQNRVAVMGNPSLGEVKVMIIGVRNRSGDTKSGEVWVNEFRMMDYDNSGGWAAQGNLNVQLSDLGTVNAQGRYVSQGYGGLEDGIASRAEDDESTYSVTAQLELGKFFPDKANVSIPFYYSITNERSKPKYNPMDTDMLLDDALESAGSKAERDSIKNIAITNTRTTNLSFSGVHVGIMNKKHPTPIDPNNFTLSFSRQNTYTTGETTVYEKEFSWQGVLDYSWTPVYKALEPWKKSKSKSKWMDMLKQFSLNWLPQNISFSSDINRTYYELQERDMEATDDYQLPVSFSSEFLWNRDFSIRWDITKSIHMNFSSATHAEIEEPYTPVNKDLYADSYSAWKDSIWTSIKNLGTPLDYQQNFSLSFSSPLDRLPILDWTKFDASYKSDYAWVRGSELEDGTSLGHTISNSRTINANGSLNLEKLYNHFPFLKAANDRFKKDPPKSARGAQNNRRERNAQAQKDALPKNKKAFEKVVTLMPDTTIMINHARKTKRIDVTARTEDGKSFALKFKKKDLNNIVIKNKVDSATNITVRVAEKEPLDDKTWYKNLQSAARFLMMVRSVSVSYQNNQSLSLSGFMPMVGDILGERKTDGYLAPGLGFAFGLEGESFLEKAQERGWLLNADSVATPAAVAKTEDLQIKLSLEPVRNLKIDLNASRTMTTAKSIQYMYEGMPTTYTGTFSMTTISLRSAFEGIGNANNGYRSKSFERFCNSLDAYQQRVEAQYAGAVYPEGTELAGQPFDAEKNGGVDKYSSDVLVPAFLGTYTANNSSLRLFPLLNKILPNWSIKYTGLSKLTWFKNRFKSVTLSHAYKSVYAVGSYSSYSTFMEYMNGLGFVSNAVTGMPTPSSMYNISTVSINEAFSPLIGVDVTFFNNMTAKLEYKQTRVLALSVTSVQINETISKDWTAGWGYKIQNIDLFGGKNHRKVKTKGRNNGEDDDEDSGAKAKQNANAKGQLNHDLNLRLDLSYRKQAAICRDIASVTSTASSGNNAFKLSFSAEYTLSKLMTMSFYYDMQKNTPLLSSNSYPTTTQDFGLSIKFSLKR